MFEESLSRKRPPDVTHSSGNSDWQKKGPEWFVVMESGLKFNQKMLRMIGSKSYPKLVFLEWVWSEKINLT